MAWTRAQKAHWQRPSHSTRARPSMTPTPYNPGMQVCLQKST
jgi:hypothetical protein